MIVRWIVLGALVSSFVWACTPEPLLPVVAPVVAPTHDASHEDENPKPFEAEPGSRCQNDDACAGKAVCLTEEDGFGEGMCATPCQSACSDRFFCHSSGYCLPRCESGCREGYGCRIVTGRTRRDWPMDVCLPRLSDWTGQSDCQRQLDALGMVYRAAEHRPERPPGDVQDVCLIEDPIFLAGPIHGVQFRFVGSAPEPMLMACPLALALEKTAKILSESEIVDVEHIGTYNCRTIGDSTRLSQHAYGMGIDLQSFSNRRGRTWSVPKHWVRDRSERLIPRGRWLRGLAQRLHDEYVFNIVLTPDYNEGHKDHFHLDLTEGRHFIRHGAREFLLGED